MKKSVQKLFKGLLITTVTLLCGFGICAIFFNLFGTLTANEMKIFVALDVIILLTVGGIFYCIDEKKTKNKIKEKEFEKRHNERVEKAFREFNGLDMVKIWQAQTIMPLNIENQYVFMIKCT